MEWAKVQIPHRAYYERTLSSYGTVTNKQLIPCLIVRIYEGGERARVQFYDPSGEPVYRIVQTSNIQLESYAGEQRIQYRAGERV